MNKNKTAIRLAAIGAAAVACGIIAGSNFAYAGPLEDNCRTAVGAERATCCSKVESTTIFGRLFGGGCMVVSRGDLGHGRQASSISMSGNRGATNSSEGHNSGGGDNGGGNNGAGSSGGGGNN